MNAFDELLKKILVKPFDGYDNYGNEVVVKFNFKVDTMMKMSMKVVKDDETFKEVDMVISDEDMSDRPQIVRIIIEGKKYFISRDKLRRIANAMS